MIRQHRGRREEISRHFLSDARVVVTYTGRLGAPAWQDGPAYLDVKFETARVLDLWPPARATTEHAGMDGAHLDKITAAASLAAGDVQSGAASSSPAAAALDPEAAAGERAASDVEAASLPERDRAVLAVVREIAEAEAARTGQKVKRDELARRAGQSQDLRRLHNSFRGVVSLARRLYKHLPDHLKNPARTPGARLH